MLLFATSYSRVITDVRNPPVCARWTGETSFASSSAREMKSARYYRDIIYPSILISGFEFKTFWYFCRKKYGWRFYFVSANEIWNTIKTYITKWLSAVEVSALDCCTESRGFYSHVEQTLCKEGVIIILVVYSWQNTRGYVESLFSYFS